MRHSVAILSGTPIRLAELRFPAGRVQIHRTRLAYIHLDQLLHFGKIDRDGRVDGYIAAYLPDELLVLLLRNGDVVTGFSLGEKGRAVRPIATLLKHMKEEQERSELVFCEAPLEQLIWMYHSVTAPARPRPANPKDPRGLFLALQQEQYSGILELIVGGEVSYLRFVEGRYQNGYFAGKEPDEEVHAYFERAFAPRPEGTPPVAASGFAAGVALVEQAPPAMVAAFRDVFWRILDAAEQEVPGEGKHRGLKLRDTLAPVHEPLRVLGLPREAELEPCLLAPDALTFGLADWTTQLLEQLEIIAPGAAPQVLKQATREHRYVLQRAGFFTRLPWPVNW